MNKWQKGVLGNRVEEDEKILKKIKKAYQQAEKDIDDKINSLLARKDTENMQSIIYRVEYQKALKSQINGILESLNTNQFDDISKYLTTSYENGFVGTMYDLAGQGIPLVLPMDQEAVVRALKNNSKLSKNLWGSLYDRNSALQGKLRAELSRGISQGYSYGQIAKRVSDEMGIGYNQVAKIVRTESHRIANEAAMDAQYKAKEAGADIVKQWDASMDKRTRPEHRMLDGQIRELDEPFEVNGNTAMYPGGFGVPGLDIHCRCAILQRAKWALDEEELETLKERAKAVGLDKNDSFEEYKKKYLKAVEEIKPTERNYESDIAKAFGKDNFDAIRDRVDAADGRYSRVWDKYEEQLHVVDANYTRTAHYNRDDGGIRLNIAQDAEGSDRGVPYSTTFHEFGHNIDNLAGRAFSGFTETAAARFNYVSVTYKGGEFQRTIEREIDDYISKLSARVKKEFAEHAGDLQWFRSQGYIYSLETTIPKYSKRYAYKAFEKELGAIPGIARADISDIVEGATKAKVRAGFGHGKSYWTYPGSLAKEAFAEMFNASIANPESRKILEQYLPESIKFFNEIMEEIWKKS